MKSIGIEFNCICCILFKHIETMIKSTCFQEAHGVHGLWRHHAAIVAQRLLVYAQTLFALDKLLLAVNKFPWNTHFWPFIIVHNHKSYLVDFICRSLLHWNKDSYMHFGSSRMSLHVSHKIPRQESRQGKALAARCFSCDCIYRISSNNFPGGVIFQPGELLEGGS